MSTKIRHIAIHTDDHFRMANFYKTVFGMRKITAGMTDRNGDYDKERGHLSDGVIGLALLGFLIARYLALYQWRIVSWVWDPFFPEGSVSILNSKISNILPIPDAALGAISYLVDAVTGAIGGRARWRTMPWIVIVFGLAVGPLGVVSVMLVVFQPVLFDAWCTLCLASAIVSLMMIGPAMDEVLALDLVETQADAAAIGLGQRQMRLARDPRC